MKSICAVNGVRAAGIKEGKFGLTLVDAQGTAAGVFTSNIVRAPGIELMIERIKQGRLEAIIANSGCANAYTGKRGYQDAEQMAAIAGDSLHIDQEHIGVASTGVIGRYLDLQLIEQQCKKITPLLANSSDAEDQAARAIMTTDLVSKHALVDVGSFRVAGICKGSGMIAPNMGTMLAFIYTDASIDPNPLKSALRKATRRTFNRIVVDGDMSTNDIALCTATGEVGRVSMIEFEQALEKCCRSLAQQIAGDGEGATKLIEVWVRGASDESTAADIARSIVGSSLVKAAIYGEDPNWGRILAAAGKSGHAFDPYDISLWIGNDIHRIPLVDDGKIVVDLNRARGIIHQKKVLIEFKMNIGNGEATAWGCDLTEEYVRINGRYTT